jgi:hypothetical protein
MSIKLNDNIFTLLSASTGLTALVGTKIFPVIIPAKTVLPAVMIQRSSVPQYTRDGVAGYDSVVEIAVLAANYNDSVTIATLIDNILNGYRTAPIVNSRLVDVNEGYQEEAFFQTLTYAVKNY